ncbi:imidazole glycerol phosphate synthase subunit HisH [Helicovermis profundi]|uniref:Imidazole glycerol phosphate synthase subunit HisH n=1 Tax=Helicovermis profundi TaxID=3065157 RepID=A0AAU9E2M8_9FIRM|nr:imidazole glycerol phosphate synthase subunit HisH [Clostridia bacterium S502]
MLVIIDYKVGNILNAYNFFKDLDKDIKISSDKEEIMAADIVVLPGVGAFEDAMISLKNTGLDKVIKSLAKENKTIIGICLGMQVLFDKSYENGEFEGLGLLKGEFIKFNFKDSTIKVPHMGWNILKNNSIGSVNELSNSNSLLTNDLEDKYAYFVHSYYLSNYNNEDLLLYANYNVKVPAMVRKNNIIGMQFHPEKSSDTGKLILNNLKKMLIKKE